MNLRVILEHELDISWILALWFAIHGGDPGPEGGVLEVSEETYRLANGLVENLLTTYAPYGVRTLSHAELEAQLVKVGVGSIHPGTSTGGTTGGEITGGGTTSGGPTGPDTGPGGVTVGPSCWHMSANQIRCWKVSFHAD